MFIRTCLKIVHDRVAAPDVANAALLLDRVERPGRVRGAYLRGKTAAVATTNRFVRGYRKAALVMPCFALLIGCGGPGPDADIPTAEPAGATFADIGDYTVHFTSLTTDQIPPEVAAAYNIVRSKNRAMLTVSLIRKSDGQSVTGDVSVKTVNLTGQLKNVTMRKIEEPGEASAVYYIGVIPVANRETLIFDLTVRPETASEPFEVRFKREFYTDG